MPEPDDTLRSIDATVEMWERRSDAMAWRSDAVAAIDSSGLPLAPPATPAFAPDLAADGWRDVGYVDTGLLGLGSGPARAFAEAFHDECGRCHRRYCDGRDQCQAPTALIHGLDHYVPPGRAPVAYMYQFLDNLTTATDRRVMPSVSWARHRLARYLTEDPRYPDGALLADVVQDAGHPGGAQGTVVLVIAHVPAEADLSAPARHPISGEDQAAPYRTISPVLRPTFLYDRAGGDRS